METLRDKPYVNRRYIIYTIFKEYINELDGFVALDMVAYFSRDESWRPSGMEEEPKKVIELNNPKLRSEMESYMLLLDSGHQGVLVAAASFRMRLAFRYLLENDQMIKQRKQIEDFLKLKSLKDEKEKHLLKKGDLVKERQLYTTELANLINNSSKWKEELGPEIFSTRISRVIAMEGEVESQLKSTEERISRLDQSIELLTALKKDSL